MKFFPGSWLLLIVGLLIISAIKASPLLACESGSTEPNKSVAKTKK